MVASEVLNLAQRSANAVKDIAALIEESGQRVGSGVQLVQDAGKTMQEMTQAVNSVRTIIGEIVTASDEQVRGISQVTIAVNEMDGTTQQNAVLFQQMSDGAVGAYRGTFSPQLKPVTYSYSGRDGWNVTPRSSILIDTVATAGDRLTPFIPSVSP